MSGISETLNTALQHHQAGRLQQAESLYREILREDPEHPDALHLLGVAAHQSGRQEEAVASIRRAIELKPAAEFYVNLAAALGALARYGEAAESCRTALSIQPNVIGAHFNLGRALTERGELAQAAEHYRRELQLTPNRAEVHYNLGNVLYSVGQLDEAVRSFSRAVEIRPKYAAAHYNLGKALQDRGS
jgi:tetratricopeptide (TPR) repeat protein